METKQNFFNNTFLAHCGDVFICIDCNGSVLEFNSVSEVLFEIPRAKIIGENFFTVCENLGLQVSFNASKLKAAVMTEPVFVNGYIQFANQQKHSMRWKFIYCLDKSNEMPYFLIIGKDVSTFQSQETKDSLVNNLRQQEIDATNQSKMSFLERVKHDLRTPVTNIVNTAEYLVHSLEDMELKNRADSIVQSSLHLLDYINEISKPNNSNSQEKPFVKIDDEFKTGVLTKSLLNTKASPINGMRDFKVNGLQRSYINGNGELKVNNGQIPYVNGGTMSGQGVKDTKIESNKPGILIVEDDVIAAHALKDTLSSLGHTAEVANSGKKALEYFKSGKYNLIYMDLALPDIDGYEVAKYIRESETGVKNKVFIVALSAHMDPIIKSQCYDLGMNEVYTKPLLVDRVRETLKKQHEYRSSFAVSTSADALKVIDLNLGATLINSDTNAAKEMLKLLVKSLPEFSEILEKAYQEKNIENIIKSAHKLHGGLCYVGAPRLKNAVNQLESKLKSGEINHLDQLYQSVHKELDAFLEVYESNKERFL